MPHRSHKRLKPSVKAGGYKSYHREERYSNPGAVTMAENLHDGKDRTELVGVSDHWSEKGPFDGRRRKTD